MMNLILDMMKFNDVLNILVYNSNIIYLFKFINIYNH